ncbi:YkyB family protein [Caldibacillus lycopersici]|uniref:YkyB family protein n=1 Tax=Perspicuibacillus lycopersici TaxID=1325689 RepID=A0AAE3LMQ9_9BACI|nr:YkyB family protein [Perspicuibacillus lycopersici]MCU9613181.1 YkyB family protein [Perspicuibacillus lycopersici]
MDSKIRELACAIYKINSNAKAATDPNNLYTLKYRVIKKLLNEGLATKIGLHNSMNPRFPNKKHVLVKIEDYYFHIPATPEDYKNLPLLGDRDENYRNPKCYISLQNAKSVLFHYLDMKESNIVINTATVSDYVNSTRVQYLNNSKYHSTEWLAHRY